MMIIAGSLIKYPVAGRTPLNVLIALLFGIVFATFAAPSELRAQSVTVQCFMQWSDNPQSSDIHYSISRKFTVPAPNDPRKSPEVSAFESYFYRLHPNIEINGDFLCDNYDDDSGFQSELNTARQAGLLEELDWPQTKVASASQASSGADKSALKVNQCLSVAAVTGPAGVSEVHLNNRCEFNVQAAFCYTHAPGNLFSCTTHAIIGGSGNIDPGGYILLQDLPPGVQRSHVKWVACRGQNGDVLPIITLTEGVLRGECK